MWPVSPPATASAISIFTGCAQAEPDPPRAGLISVAADVSGQVRGFEAAMTRGDRVFDPNDYVVPTITAAQMSDLYDRQFAGTRGAARHVYNQIRASVSLCPACGVGDVTQVDHYLPKARFPALAVAPPNLTPICGPCNFRKRASYGRRIEEAAIHPYFDDFSMSQWLIAAIDQDPVPHVEFSVSPTIPNPLGARIAEHLRRFNLPTYYAKLAARAIAQAVGQLEKVLESGGPHAVADELRARENSARAASSNSHEAATWQAGADSRWFSAGGFKEFTA